MRPTKLKLSNWCQHREKEIVLSDGMNSITGPNGSGKSNLLDALLMGLAQETNNVSTKSDKKTDNIMHGEDRARIELEFEHQDQKGLITVDLKRNYRTDSDVLQREVAHAKQLLAAQGEEGEEVTDEVLRLAGFKPRETVSTKMVWGDLRLRNTKEVGEWMLSVTKMQPRALKEAYFPSQGNVDAVIAGSGEERYRALAEQAGITLCARIYQYLGDEIRAQPDFGGVDQEFRELEAREAVARGDLERAEAENRKWADKEIDVDGPRTVLAEYAVASKALESLNQAQERLALARQAAADTQPELDRLLAEGKRLREKTDAGAQKASEARELLTRAQAAQERKTQLSGLYDSLTGIQREQEALSEPGDMPQGQPDTIRAEIAHLQQEAEQKTEWIRLFESGECPTCGQPVSDARQKVVEYRKRIDQIADSVRSMTSSAEALERALAEWHREYEAFTRTSAELNERATHTQARIQQLEEGLQDVPSEEQVAAAHELIAGQVADLDQLQAAREAYNQKVSLHERAEAEVKTAEALVASSQAQLEGSPTAEQATAASEALSQAQIDQQAQRDASNDLQIKKGLYDQVAKDLERVRQRYDLAQPTREWVGLLGKTRDLFHRDALPRDAVLWYAGQLIEHANHYLGMFESDFQMTMTEDMSFLAVFGDKVQPSTRLSGGQKNMLSLSIRLAMADLFPSDLRLLVLDEVEVHLDQENVARLPIVLEQVKGLARNRGLTVLFVSHHPSLSDVSDHVINAAA